MSDFGTGKFKAGNGIPENDYYCYYVNGAEVTKDEYEEHIKDGVMNLIDELGKSLKETDDILDRRGVCHGIIGDRRRFAVRHYEEFKKDMGL